MGSMAMPLKERLRKALRRGMGEGSDRRETAGRGTTERKANQAAEMLREAGILSVHYASSPDELAEWADRLWIDQDDPLEDRHKEWWQALRYVANEQFIAYHRSRKEWVALRTVPWKIRASYNICSKAVEIRVNRLTSNKPSVTVQASTASAGDVERAEYKETLFWGLWDKLRIHSKIVSARTWATICASGILKATWDPDAGCEYPVTRKRPRYETITVPVTDPVSGAPVPDPAEPDGVAKQQRQVYAGIEEVYLDAQGNELGLVEELVDDPDHPGQKKTVRPPPPKEADFYHEGEIDLGVRSPFNVRWDRYADDPWDSWYVQDKDVLPASKILALMPDAAEVLEDAEQASDEERSVAFSQLRERDPSNTGAAERRQGKARAELAGDIDREYAVLETWIFPKNPLLKKLWGSEGAYFVTVGGKLVGKVRALPKWARKACPFVRLVDLPEEGNHYGKSILRDVIPLQDDINRARSMMAERLALESRLILGAPQNHGMNLRLLGGMPGVLLTVRSRDHLPQPIQLTQQGEGADRYYQSSLEAATDLGQMNDASTGKLPSAGLAAKAIYALQYADEQGTAKTSTLQDESLKQLARLLDAIASAEYVESRKVKLVGEDRTYMLETEILPEHLDTEVDFWFSPGSMMSRQKENVKNELLELLDKGLVDPPTVRKNLATATPDVFRTSYDLQAAKAKRRLYEIVRKGRKEVQPDPWDDPAIHAGVLTEFMLTAKYELLGDSERALIMQLWQAYTLMMQGSQLPAQGEPQPGQQPQGTPEEGQQGTPQPGPGEQGYIPPPAGVPQLAAVAEQGVAPPPGYHGQ